MNTDLKAAESMGGTMVNLVYGDGFAASLDLRPALRGPIFEPVQSPDYFARFQIESDTLRWPNGADIDPYVLRLWAENGRVLSQEETDAYFFSQGAAHRAA
jgi:hypothetical protein